ncbi:exonuclease 1 isoform X1 [Tanacetum coccineum]
MFAEITTITCDKITKSVFMCIDKLFAEIKYVLVKTELSRLGSCTLAVDANNWLFQSMRPYYGEIINKKHLASIKYVKSFMARVNELRSHNIVPYIVFDGAKLPTKKNRYRTRNLVKDRAAKKSDDAKKYFSNATSVTRDEVYFVIQNVSYVVAPYEADAQLAYLYLKGHAKAILNPDSDLIAYGCKKQEGSKAFTGFTQDMVLQTCILGGYDYVSIRGVGIKGAINAMRDHNGVMNEEDDYFCCS